MFIWGIKTLWPLDVWKYNFFFVSATLRYYCGELCDSSFFSEKQSFCTWVSQNHHFRDFLIISLSGVSLHLLTSIEKIWLGVITWGKRVKISVKSSFCWESRSWIIKVESFFQFIVWGEKKGYHVHIEYCDFGVCKKRNRHGKPICCLN